MKAKYDDIGINYALQRRSDPIIAAQIHAHLKGAKKIVNIGAGTGSYELSEFDLVALEPSIEMINQRSKNAHPAIKGYAEALPFPNKSFSHALTILSMHHWKDRPLAFNEINRVVTDKFIAITWNPKAKPFWLTKDYFPEIFNYDQIIFPDLSEFSNYFDDVSVEPLLIPEDCLDGFLAANWKRPEAYLNEAVRNSISSFSKLKDVSKGLQKLKTDLKTGHWLAKNASILKHKTLDTGYVIVTAKTRKSIQPK